MGATSGRLTTPLMRLQDPGHTKVMVVTLPEATPVLEAEELAADLARAGIHPWAWVVNGSLAAAATSDPLLVTRAAGEVAQIARVMAADADRCAVVPLMAHDPVGVPALRALVAAHALEPADV
jgi:arsenite-transporting ATPase